MLTLLVKLSEKLRMNITDRVRGLLVPVTVSKKRKADFENSSEESEIKIKKVKTHLVTMKPICWITERDVKLGLGVN